MERIFTFLILPSRESNRRAMIVSTDSALAPRKRPTPLSRNDKCRGCRRRFDNICRPRKLLHPAGAPICAKPRRSLVLSSARQTLVARQCGCIPPAARGLDEERCRRHSLALECSGPSASLLSSVVWATITFTVGHDARTVLIHDYGQGVLRRLHRFLLCRGLTLEDAQGRQVILHLLKARKDRLPIGGDGGIVRGAGFPSGPFSEPPSNRVSEIAGPMDQNLAAT